MAFFLITVLTSKVTYTLIAFLLAFLCGVLIWLGGYENTLTYLGLLFTGAGSLGESWSWRYGAMQKAGVGAGVLAVIIGVILALLSFSSSDSEEDFDTAPAYPPFSSTFAAGPVPYGVYAQ